MKYLLAFLCFSGIASASELSTLKLEVELQCPASAELQALLEVIPKEGKEENNWDEWKADFIINMQRVLDLIKSDNVGNSAFSISVEPQQQTDSN